MQQQRLLRFIPLLMLLALIWAGCGATRADRSYEAASVAGSAGEPAAAEPVQEAQEGGALDRVDTRKIIATADVDLVVADTEQAVTEIEALVQEAGGFVSNVNLYRSGYGDVDLLRGSLTLRVPAERLEETLDALADLAVEVESSTLDREDVTEQYSDVDAQLRNLQATEEELRALLAEVRERPDATPEDILAVHRSLTEIRGEIEQLQGRKNLLDNQIALSTINVTLIPDAANRPLVEEGWRPAVVVRDAVRALTATLQFLGNALIWVVVYLLPLAIIALIPIGILIWLLRWLIRRLRSRSTGVEATP